MGEWQPPTGADYAQAAANTARRENAALAVRVTALEERCDLLLRILVEITHPVIAERLAMVRLLGAETEHLDEMTRPRRPR